MLTAAGAHAARVPLVETDLLAGWLLHAAGMPLPDGPLTAVAGVLEVDGDRGARRAEPGAVGACRGRGGGAVPDRTSCCSSRARSSSPRGRTWPRNRATR